VTGLRAVAAAALGLCVLLAASGWLYLLRPHALFGGPRVGDALPLDELPAHSAVALPAYLSVWAVSAVLLGLLARWARAERLTAALLLATAVGSWTYATTGLSILVVRQIPAEDAFHAATRINAVWLPALLTGIAGALLGRQHVSARPRAPLVLSILVAGIWWSVADGVIRDQREESGLLYREIERLNPRAPVPQVVGRWRHCFEFRADWKLPQAMRFLGLN
jgi:hypothetical protein